MTSIPEHLPNVAPASRARLIALAASLLVVMAVAFAAGRVTAPSAAARTTAIRPVHLTASLRSADGARRLHVMRKMNRLGSGDGR